MDKNVPRINQFNDLVEIQYHASSFNDKSIGIEFSNRDWEDGKGIKKDKTGKLIRRIDHKSVDKKGKEQHRIEIIDKTEELAEKKGYFHAFWGDGYNVYKLPDIDQLEKLVELLNRLIRKLDQGFPMINNVWLQVVSYNNVKDFFEFDTADIPDTDLKKDAVPYFIYTNGSDYMVPERFKTSAKPEMWNTGILSHASLSNVISNRLIDEDAHTDGSFQALYSWLRIAKGFSKDDAYAKCKDLLSNHMLKVKTKQNVKWKDNGEQTGQRKIYLLNLSNT